MVSYLSVFSYCPWGLLARILEWVAISTSSGPRVALHGKAYSFTELCKPLQHDKAVINERITVSQVISAEGMADLQIFLFCKFPSKNNFINEHL